MKRILKTSILSFILCLTAVVFNQNASACGERTFTTTSCSYDSCTGCSVPTTNVYKSGYVPCRGCKYVAQPYSYYKAYTYPVTIYKTGYTCHKGCQYRPQYYTYYKHYCYPVKSIKCYPQVKPVCNSCNSDYSY